MIEVGHASQEFPDAPRDAWICEEGWLIIDDEAWTPEEWAARRRWNTGRRIKYDDPKHVRDRERKRRLRTA